jgi:predicted MFS family arabinose efflux permease
VRSSGSDAGAGLASGALLLATVAAELATPRLVVRAGYRLSLAAGLVLLGAPALALLWPAPLAVVVAVSIVRGIGFAITTVAGGALTVSLIPAQRRGEGLGLAGIVGGIPALVSLPAGVWAASRWGYSPVFAATAAAALLALGSVCGLPGRRETGHRTSGAAAGLRNPGLARLAGLFSASAMAAGVLVTFLPLAVTAASAAVATLALFAQPAAATAARWAAGRIGDRCGQARLLCPGVLLSAAGMACLAATHTPALVVGGAACFGTGFGLLQNATLAMMYALGPRSAYSTVSAIWNAAYDAGMGVGAVGIGLLAAHTGYPPAFMVTAALVLTAVVPALGERARSGAGGRTRPPEAQDQRTKEGSEHRWMPAWKPPPRPDGGAAGKAIVDLTSPDYGQDASLRTATGLSPAAWQPAESDTTELERQT